MCWVTDQWSPRSWTAPPPRSTEAIEVSAWASRRSPGTSLVSAWLTAAPTVSTPGMSRVAAEASAVEVSGWATAVSVPPLAMSSPAKLWVALVGPWLEFAWTGWGSWSFLNGGCWPHADTVVSRSPKMPRSSAVAWERPSVPW